MQINNNGNSIIKYDRTTPLYKIIPVYQSTLIIYYFYIHLIMLLLYQQGIQNIFIIFYFYT